MVQHVEINQITLARYVDLANKIGMCAIDSKKLSRCDWLNYRPNLIMYPLNYPQWQKLKRIFIDSIWLIFGVVPV
jgi:hypothetical protein